MSDQEDDYMSESFLSNAEHVAPGISSLPSQRRMLKLSARKDRCDEDIRSLPKKADLERERREEALAKPVGEESKGFALLAKMGYKPGMTLGKKKEGDGEKPRGLMVPIGIEMKAGRSGLGHDTEQKEQSQKRVEMHMKRMEFQSKYQHVLMSDFRKRKRDTTIQKQLIGDLIRSRKACQELDVRQGREGPAEPWFWPIYADKRPDLDDDLGNAMKAFKRDPDELSPEETTYKYANGTPAPVEENLYDLYEDELMERLQAITEYLRGAHSYCIWCGHAFESHEELRSECPGNTRSLHDEDEL